MTNADKLHKALGDSESQIPEMQKRTDAISSRIRGWSILQHYWFFKAWMDAFAEEGRAMRVLIVGVYLGRDITFMLDAAGSRPLHVTGVDKFNAEPCDDWPKEKLHMTWEEAFNCPPPDMEKALENIAPKLPHEVRLIKADDKDWLESATGTYDLIFLDASHEYASISRQIRAVHKLCHPNTIVAGDDYSNVQPGWGVTEAVKEAFKFHHHISYRVWFAGAEDYL
jgi:hypothetical protein